MRGDGTALSAGPTRRAVLVGGILLATIPAGIGAEMAVAARRRSSAALVATPAATATAGPQPTASPPPPAAPPPLAGPPLEGIELHPAYTSAMQCFVAVPQTGEWFTTQASPGVGGLVDPAGLAVGDVVVSRLASDGTLLDSMTLPDSGHGMGLVVRFEAGARVLYVCWFAPGATGRLYDVVRLPYVPGIATRAAATTVVAGSGYPVDPYYDVSTDSVTLRNQGGGGPEYTRHRWADFTAGDLSRPTGQIATPDSPPTHQGFCSLGDRFFFSTGAASTKPGGDPALITEYSWASGATVGPPLDASGNSRQPDGTYPGGSMEPEGATIVLDGSGAAALLIGVTNGAGPQTGGRKVNRTFRYPLAES